MISYHWTRHFHRYEYPCRRNWLDKKVVMDVGCGTGFGLCCIAGVASKIYGVDISPTSFPIIANKQPQTMILTMYSTPKFGGNAPLFVIPNSIYTVTQQVDVCVAVEIFEHMDNPQKFIDHLSTLCTELFITTPLSDITKKTRNTNHVVEYSREDFQRIVSTRFEIVEAIDQLSDMTTTTNAPYSGDSIDEEHVVQMLWCKKK